MRAKGQPPKGTVGRGTQPPLSWRRRTFPPTWPSTSSGNAGTAEGEGPAPTSWTAFLGCGESLRLDGTFTSQRLLETRSHTGHTAQHGSNSQEESVKPYHLGSVWEEEVLVGAVTALALIATLSGGKARSFRLLESQRNGGPERAPVGAYGSPNLNRWLRLSILSGYSGADSR